MFHLDNVSHSPTRVVAYAAFSPAHMPHKDTFIHFLQLYLHDAGNYELTDVYLDSMPASDPVDCRPEWQRLDSDRMAGKFDMVVIPSLSQFATQLSDAYTFIRELTIKPCPVAVKLMYENILVSDTAGALELNFHMMIMDELQQLEDRAVQLRTIFHSASNP